MELETLKKKLSTYKTDGGYLKNVSDDLLVEILNAWENWNGPSADFYRAIGTNSKRFASLLGKAKKLKREGHEASGFAEVKLEPPTPKTAFPIEIEWDNGRSIRFQEVDFLVDFLKKAA